MRIPTFRLLGAVLCTALVSAPLAQTETPAQKDARMAWWREAKFGMFIHWGLYAIPAGEWNGKVYGGASEWLLNTAQIKVAEYEPLKPQFNPVQFDAKRWVQIAKDAGMKYIVITSKHHEGFAMFDTKQTDWGIMHTPFKRDPLKELAAACKAAGIKLCFYHSIMDWHHPDYLPRRGWDPRPEVQANFPRYVEFMKAQLKELLTNYGPIGILWFDGEWESTWNHDLGVDLYNYVKALQPNIIINNRVDSNRAGMSGMSTGIAPVGDYGTPEQEIPASGIPGKDWESCMTMNGSWGFHKTDTNWKSSQTLVRNLVDCVSKGGNYLLNVGPTAEGLIPGASVERLAEVGAWLKKNGEAVYGAKPSPFPKALPWGFATQKPGKLYLHVFETDRSQIELPGLRAQITKAYALGDRTKRSLKAAQSEKGWTVSLPASGKPETIATVVVAEVRGSISAEAVPILPADDESVTLDAIDATPHGSLRFEGGDKQAIGFWTKASDWVGWEFEVKHTGPYSVSMEYACEPGADESEIVATIGTDKLEATVRSTGSWTTFKPVDLGQIWIRKAGKVAVEVRAKSMPKGAVMNLRRIVLRPIYVTN